MLRLLKQDKIFTMLNNHQSKTYPIKILANKSLRDIISGENFSKVDPVITKIWPDQDSKNEEGEFVLVNFDQTGFPADVTHWLKGLGLRPASLLELLTWHNLFHNQALPSKRETQTITALGTVFNNTVPIIYSHYNNKKPRAGWHHELSFRGYAPHNPKYEWFAAVKIK